jgi:cytochrome P450
MVEYDPHMEEVLDDPYPIYRRLRDEAPVYWVESYGAWALSRFAEQWEVTQDDRHLTAREGTTPHYFGAKAIPALPNLNHMDPPAQQLLRSELLPFFLPRRVRRIEAELRPVVRACIDAFLERGEADAVREIGQIVASRLASMAIGFPPGDSVYIVDLVKRFLSREPGRDGITQTGVAAFEEMQRYLASVARARREYRGEAENPLDVLLRTEVEGAKLDDEVIGQHLILLLVGATETFPKAFAGAVHRLWQHPDQRRELAARPEWIPMALRECLRYDMPTQFAMRKVVGEFEIAGQRLRPGELVMFLWPSGNRDEREFPDADRFDIHRNPRRFLFFGNGTHRCLGAHFAQMEGRILLEELLARAADYELDLSGAERERGELFRGFSKLPIRVGAGPGA